MQRLKRNFAAQDRVKHEDVVRMGKHKRSEKKIIKYGEKGKRRKQGLDGSQKERNSHKFCGMGFERLFVRTKYMVLLTFSS